VQPAPKTNLTYAEYLEIERSTDQKHEFLRGAVYAMAGGTPEHGFLAGNLIHLLRTLIGDRPCIVGTSDVKVRVEATGLSTYPYASVVCGAVERASDDPHAITNPVVLVEVLSDSTEAHDRGSKFAHYRRMPSLQDYVLVSQRERRVEVYHREQGGWTLLEATQGGEVEVRSLGGKLSVDAVYRGVDLPEAI
jgi:Uma2 family endonuclease